jgi:hypothetical protein
MGILNLVRILHNSITLITKDCEYLVYSLGALLIFSPVCNECKKQNLIIFLCISSMPPHNFVYVWTKP